MEGLASVQLCDHLRRRRANQSIKIKDRFRALYHGQTERLVHAEGSVAWRFGHAAGTRIATHTCTRCQRRPPSGRANTGANARVIFARYAFFGRFFRRRVIVFNDQFSRYLIGFRHLVRFFHQGFRRFKGAAFEFPAVRLRFRRVSGHVREQAHEGQVLSEGGLASPLFARLNSYPVVVDFVIVRLIRGGSGQLVGLFYVPRLISYASFRTMLNVRCRRYHIYRIRDKGYATSGVI